MKLQPKIHRILKWHIDNLVTLGFQPIDNARFRTGKTDGSELRRDRHDHQVDVDVIFVDEGKARFPTFLAEPVFDLAGPLLLRAGAAAADQDTTLLDDVEITALERCQR